MAVELRWHAPGTGAAMDPTTGAYVGGTGGTVQTETVHGFWNEITDGTTGYRQHEEVKSGDGVLELPVGTVISGRSRLVFRILGEDWVQKEVGESLARVWGVMEGAQLYMTLLLKRQT